MYCTHCGKQIDDRAAICVHCGLLTETGKLAFSPSAGAHSPAPTVKNAEQVPSVKRANPFAIAGFTAATVSTVVGILSYALVMFSDLAPLMTGVFLLCLLGVVSGLALSVVGLVMRKRYRSGMGLSIAGIIISAACLLLFLLFFVLPLLFFGMVFEYVTLMLLLIPVGVL